MPAQEPTAMPDGWEPAVPFDRCFDALYGLEVVSEDVAGRGVVEGRVAVREALLDRMGDVGTGVLASIAEALASRGTAVAVMPGGRMAMGLSNDTSLLARVSSGTLHATATVVSRGDDQWVWTVGTSDDDGRMCGLSRVTVAVRSPRG